MQIDPTLHSPADNYKLLTNLVVPRPIAWITSLGPSGVVNLAPFSFFNAVSGNPMYVVVGIGRNDAGELKDTARNILARGEFVVNLVTEDLFEAMNVSAADFPPELGELEAAGLHAAPCGRVGTPRSSAGCTARSRSVKTRWSWARWSCSTSPIICWGSACISTALPRSGAWGRPACIAARPTASMNRASHMRNGGSGTASESPPVAVRWRIFS
jgi:flavin reductase (DIM6/NTAB) family NADH-FMN oxidoreductase RutF